MGFGYIGYIWALFGCCTLFSVLAGSAAFLYHLGRKRDERGESATVTVEQRTEGREPQDREGA